MINNKKMKRVLIVIVVFFSVAALYLFMPQKLQIIDNKLKDFIFLTKKYAFPKSVVIIDIDEKSLEKYGQWPWPRKIVAKLIENLRDYGAGVIGLDVIFSEVDSRSKKIKGAPCPDIGDLKLAKAFESSPVIGGYFFSFDFNTSTTTTPTFPLIVIEKGDGKEFIPKAKAIKLNIPCLQKSLYSSGFFNNTPDSDGVVRRVPLIVRYKGVIYPSLALEMIRVFEGVNKIVVKSSLDGVEYIQVGSRKIPVDRFGRLIVNFRGKAKTFKYISAADILEKKRLSFDISGKFVLLGTSAIGLSDIRPTPTDNLMPGVEVHANVIDNILKMDMLRVPVNIEIVDLTFILLMIILGFLIGWLIEGIFIVPILIFVLVGFFYFVKYIFLDLKVDINIFIPLLGFSGATFVSILTNYLDSTKEIKRVKEAFSKKVSQAVMKEILKESKRNLLNSKEKEVTVLFSDIRAFTTISETINSPKEVVSLLNSYLTPMVEIITSCKGTVDKFIGDAIMAYWNAPLDVINHQDKAVTSALKQIKALKKINKRLQAKNPKLYKKILDSINKDIKNPKLLYTQAINIGIGINSGVATVGEMGSIGRSDYTVIGDSVNLASRLEGLCKIYGVSIIISEYTKVKLSKNFSLRELDTVKVKGKKRAIKIYEVLEEPLSKEERLSYEKALKFYKLGKFKDALVEFEALKRFEKSYKLYDMYSKRCKILLSNQPKSWSGVFEFNIK